MAKTDVPKGKRLNPFAFPPETNVRFTLFVVTALVLAFDITLSVGLGVGALDPPESDQALTQSIKLLVLLPCLPALAVLILATIIYRAHPSRLRRAQNLRLILRDDDPHFVDTVQELVTLSGVSPSPSIEMSHGSRSVDGQAFGLRNRYALRLGGRLRLLLRKKPADFRAIILHELGHIANADVTRTYFARAIWVALVFLIFFPVLAFIAFNFIDGLYELITGAQNTERWRRLFTTVLPTILVLLLQLVGTIAIAAAIRAGLLRVREIYADWQVVLWGGETPLTDILLRGASTDKDSWWTHLWRLHPAPQERSAALQDSASLFRVKAEAPFFAGVLMGYVLHGLSSLGIQLILVVLASGMGGLQLFIIVMEQLSNSLSPLFETLDPETNKVIFNFLVIPIFLILLAMIAGLLFIYMSIGLGSAYLLADALGLDAQREAIASMIDARRTWINYLRLLIPAALVSIGFQTGFLLMPYSGLALLPELVNQLGLSILLLILSLTIMIAILMWLWLIYLRFFAKRMLGSRASKLPPRLPRLLLTIAASGLLLVVYLPVVIGQFIIESTMRRFSAITLQDGFWIIFFLTLVVTLIYGLVFGITWFLVQTYRIIRKSCCPSCNKITKKRYAVGQVCEHCGKDLAPWLFVSESPASNSA